MRIGLGWGVGSRAEKKYLRVFLWEDENWIPLELSDPLSPAPDTSRQAMEALQHPHPELCSQQYPEELGNGSNSSASFDTSWLLLNPVEENPHLLCRLPCTIPSPVPGWRPLPLHGAPGEGTAWTSTGSTQGSVRPPGMGAGKLLSTALRSVLVPDMFDRLPWLDIREVSSGCAGDPCISATRGQNPVYSLLLHHFPPYPSSH